MTVSPVRSRCGLHLARFRGHLLRIASAGLIFGMAASAPALAQDAVRIEFQSGSDHATMNGTVTGQGYVDYLLGAASGQTMTVGLTVNGTNGNGTIYFNILPPGSDGEAIYIGSMKGNNGSVELPTGGDYTIRVYLMGNDRDADKTVGYSVMAKIH